MTLQERIEQRMSLSKRQLATLDELELHLAGQEKISLVYDTIEHDLRELGHQPVTVLERLRSGKLYGQPLERDNNFRHYQKKKELRHLDSDLFLKLLMDKSLTDQGSTYFPFYATPLLETTLLGVILIDKPLKKPERQLLREYARAVGIELSPRYYRKEKDLVMRQKRAEMAQLMRDAIHDLRGRLSPVMGYTALLSRRLDADHQGKIIADKLKHVVENAGRELEYFQRVFDEGRPERSPTNLYIMIEKIMDEKRPVALQEQQIDLINTLPRTCFASVEEKALELVFQELIHNALKYSPAGAEVMVSGEKEGTTLKLYITNTGVELSEERVAHLFDHKQAQGTGLGLSFVRRVIEEEHHGSIQVKTEGNALRFEICLPVSGTSS